MQNPRNLAERSVTDPTPAQVQALREAAGLASVMPTIEGQIEAMERSTRHTVFQLIGKGELTPEKAMSYWTEMYSYHRLRTRLNTQAATASTTITRSGE